MCGRFTLQIPPELLAEIFDLREIPVYPLRYNIVPSQQVAVIRQSDDGLNSLDFLNWGLIPRWAKDPSIGNKMINARSETVEEKTAFRHAIRYQRCLVPASAFYEWKKEERKKTPLYVHLKDVSPMVFAELWKYWKSPVGEVIESCAILTTTANDLVKTLHDRMPVIIDPRDIDLWLDTRITDPVLLKPLFEPYPSDLMEMYAVNDIVNSPGNDILECIQPKET